MKNKHTKECIEAKDKFDEGWDENINKIIESNKKQEELCNESKSFPVLRSGFKWYESQNKCGCIK